MQDTFNALMKWYDTKFPEFKSNDLYLTGESYGGIYVPNLLNRIDQFNVEHEDDDSVFKPNLKGMLIINGCTNYKYDNYLATVETAKDHFLIDEEFYDKFMDNKCDWNVLEPEYDESFKKQEDHIKCLKNLAEFQKKIRGVNEYMIYSKCYKPGKQ